MFRTRLIITLVGLLTIISCTKTEVVSGRYTGVASGYYMGTNVEAFIDIVHVDDEKVNLVCDFDGYQFEYDDALVFQGDDGYFITEKSGVKASVRNGDLNFQFTSTTHPHKNVIFRGTK